MAGRLCCGLPSIPNSIDDESNYEAFNATGNNSSLSITLQKLYMWETKLLEEVQVHYMLLTSDFLIGNTKKKKEKKRFPHWIWPYGSKFLREIMAKSFT